jgi:hypothetical protein
MQSVAAITMPFEPEEEDEVQSDNASAQDHNNGRTL